MSRVNDAAARFAAQCHSNGDPRAETVEALQTLFGVNRATAYRLCSAAAAGTGTPHASEDVARLDDGSVDVVGEAERQYVAAVDRGDEPAQLRWFAILRKLRS